MFKYILFIFVTLSLQVSAYSIHSDFVGTWASGCRVDDKVDEQGNLRPPQHIGSSRETIQISQQGELQVTTSHYQSPDCSGYASVSSSTVKASYNETKHMFEIIHQVAVSYPFELTYLSGVYELALLDNKLISRQVTAIYRRNGETKTFGPMILRTYKKVGNTQE